MDCYMKNRQRLIIKNKRRYYFVVYRTTNNCVDALSRCASELGA